MSSVVGFWWFPDEEAPFLELLRKSGPLVATPSEVVRSESEIIVSDFDQVIASNASRILFTQAPYASHLKISQGKDKLGACYAPSSVSSPFISYARGGVDSDQKLRMNCLVASASYFDERGKKVEKPLEFVKWYQRVFKWVRGRTPLWHRYKTYRVTERVAQAVKDGWELVP